ncbi:uncharacterized protein LOC104883379 isoform X2 [Beta vulgaris subsp. vulgaris]|uniref:uncharacterized protein LOC104883379 isoform X2 n=1 Tax=Beta vulgaris subsp. vulgaris TaxID=3555 RepID=UPI00053F518F|nr:uncharacterized protein LOC104883379 isoform X2 [Beta vulgaris subsp. vulgaris]
MTKIETEVARTDASGYHFVPFSYGNSADSSDQKNLDAVADTSAFNPSFSVPESLLQNLPPTEKVHQIIARTALFVSKHGGQSEIVLRVKQGDNPAFGFLMPHHHLHPYFRYLVNHPEFLKADHDGKSHEEKTNEDQTGGALSLLGSAYGTGEDEDGAASVDRESKLVAPHETLAGAVMSRSHQVEQINGPENVAGKEEIVSKAVHLAKVKASALSKNHISNKSVNASVKKNADILGLTGRITDNTKASSLFPVSKVETLVVDPPLEVKRLVDRIVEIILKNGKDFEAVLIEQDKKQDRFPFLLPSNKYHPYYLKALKKAQESRISGKSFGAEKDGLLWQETDKNTAFKKESDVSSSASEAHDVSLDCDKKEKFKMVLNKSKRDALDHASKETQQQSGITVDTAAAAAILQAATRGIKKPNLDFFSKTSLSGPSRGSSNEGGQASSLGSLHSSQHPSSGQKQKENGKSCVTIPIAKEIARSAAVAAAGEADSSEAGMTREQKLKAERLRRAKMFAAMIKSGVAPMGTDSQHPASSVEPSRSQVPSAATEFTNQEVKDREGSSVPVETEASIRIEMSVRNSSDDEVERKTTKRRHYRSHKHDDSEGEDDSGRKREKDEEEDDDDDPRHSRKRHRSHQSSRHRRDRSKDIHKHRRKHSSSRSKESRRRHKHESASSPEEDNKNNRYKHDSSSDDEHKRHKRRHKNDSSSEDERKYRKRKHKHSNKDEDRHKGRSRKGERRSQKEEVELEEGEIRTKSSDQSSSAIGDDISTEASVDASKSSYQEKAPSLPPETTEVPDELRAKIRAMLLATM